MSTTTSNPIDRQQTTLDTTLDDLRQRAEIVTPYLTAGQVAKSQPPGRNGRPVHVATIIRWIVGGTVSPSGDRVRLQAVRMGGRWLTTREWLDDYACRLTPTFGNGGCATTPARTSAASTRAAERIARELDAAGIK